MRNPRRAGRAEPGLRWRRLRHLAPLIRGARGSVTAEFAVTAPAVLLLLVMCLTCLQAAVVQVQLQDAVADAVRVVARGDDEALARSRLAAAVSEATLELTREDPLVCAVASTPLRLAARELPYRLTARACALGDGA